MQFIVPREPHLHWKMLSPSAWTRKLPTPVEGLPTYYTFWARSAIFQGLKVLGISPDDTILVPSFHGATAVEPIVQYGAKIKFYKINRDCSPDFHDIQAKIDKKTRAVLAIHYFGFPQPIHQFQKLCRNYQLLLIEDCAHVLTGKIAGGVLGSFGDISIFSWRKFFPVYDGGQLVINNPKLRSDISLESPGLLFQVKVLKNILDKLIDDSSNTTIKTLFRYPRMFDTVRRFFVSSGGEPSKALSVNNYRQDFDLSSVNVPMTSISKYILRNMDIFTTYEKRRLNATYLLKAIQSLSGITPFIPELPEGICPLAFPVLAPGQKNLHVALRSKGIPAFTWGGVIHHALPIEEFPDADFLYQNLVLLPIHQSMEEADLQRMVEIMAHVRCYEA